MGILQIATWVDLLRQRGLGQGETIGHIFLEGGEERQSLSYGDLERRARAIGAWLQEHGGEGERAMLLYPPGLDFIPAFFGCLFSKTVAVPAYPPDPMRLERSLPRFLSMVQDSGARYLLTTAAILPLIKPYLEAGSSKAMLHCLSTDDLSLSWGETWRDPKVVPNDLAFLQYTSGSTASPKGVMISHDNLLQNARNIHHHEGDVSGNIGVFWLPIYHDLGLISGVLQPLYYGERVYLMSPLEFLKRPVLWLKAISRFEATHSGGPNFAYDLCVRKVREAEKSDLDLRLWRFAYNGAEPIRWETLRRFAESFRSCGFKMESFKPGYGLAEATLMVSSVPAAQGPRAMALQTEALKKNRVQVAPENSPGSRSYVGVGVVAKNTKICIVHPESKTPCTPDEIGEIWVKGPAVGLGFWGQEKASTETLWAWQTDGSGPYLRTGDLGFLLDEELFVVGRIKDLLILRGKNHHPQDIEQTMEACHPALRPGCGAAFAVEEAGEERLVLAHELDTRQLSSATEWEELSKKIAGAVAEVHEVWPHVVLLEPGQVPKTSSGKVQRGASREAYLSQSWKILFQGSHSTASNVTSFPSRDDLEIWLRAKFAETLERLPQEIDPDQPLIRYGLDSLKALELLGKLEEAWGVRLPLEKFSIVSTIRDIAREIKPSVPARNIQAE